MSFYAWRPYVSVAAKRQQAKRELAELKRQGRAVAPVAIDGRTIARSFWGQSWCVNLERYSDYESRLPRGRSYLRNGSVIDLQIDKGRVAALVSGSEVYKVKIEIAPVTPQRWRAICRDCAGTIDSLIELLQGRLAKGVMDRVSRAGDGLFPAPQEIKLSCSCPDWAGMCKHVAAVLYGVGARLDAEPRHLFVLRGVDEAELVAAAGQDMTLASAAPDAADVLDEGDVAALFGLDMVAATAVVPLPPQPSKKSKTSRKPRRKIAATAKKTKRKAKNSRPAAPAKSALKRKAPSTAGAGAD